MSRVTTAKRRALQHKSMRQARNMRELVLLARSLSTSPAFDKSLYESQRGRTFRSRETAAWDYVVVGSREGLVAGPLLVPQISAVGRRKGVGAAAAWAAAVRTRGFPSTTALPLAGLHWYAEQHAEARTFQGGVLAHYVLVGNAQGLALGPRHTDGSDPVAQGRAAVLAAGSEAHDLPAPGPMAAQVSVIVAGSDSLGIAHGVIDDLLDPAVGVDEVIVVSLGDRSPESGLIAHSLSVMWSHVTIVDHDSGPAAALSAAIAATSGDVVLLITERLATTVRDVQTVIDAARVAVQTPVVVAPIVLAADDTVHSAGVVIDGDDVTMLLEGYPLADAERAGDHDVDAVSGEILAFTRAALATGAGFVEISSADDSTTSAASRFSREVSRAGGHVRVVSSATVDLPKTSETPPRRSKHVAASAPAYADIAWPEVLRWAIKSPHPAGPRRKAWGDYHFAKALAQSLSELGHQVAIDPLDSWYRDTAVEDHVTLTLRGLSRYRPLPHQVNLSWIISHPELVTDDELDDFDAVFAASITWSRRRTEQGHQVRPLLQCTDASSFDPDAGIPGTGYSLLFVGNSRSARRPIVEAAVSTGRDLAVIGGGWTGRLPDGVVRGEYLANDELPAAYRSAGVVLNDHWPEMASEGFLSNRLFDLTAAGARWVSDPATDLDEVFPHGRVARDAQELDNLLAGFPDSFPSEDELQAASQRVRAEHSFDVRARELSAAALELHAQRRSR